MGRSRAIVIASAMNCTIVSTLGAQSPARGARLALEDTVATLMAVAAAGDVNLHGTPRLVPAVQCWGSPLACRRQGYWQKNVARGRVLLDSIEAMLPKRDSLAAGGAPSLGRMELTAPVFFGPARDSARVELGVRARLGKGPRGDFESDTHVVVARDPARGRWIVVRRFTHRIT